MTAELLVQEPGIYRGIPDHEYHAAEGLSRSRLWDLRTQGPKYAKKNPRIEKKAFLIGDAVHCLLLEPDEFAKRFVVYEGIRNKGHKAYKEFLAGPGRGRKVLSPAEDGIAKSILREIEKTHTFKTLFRDLEPEVSISHVDPETGLLIRTRPDAAMFGLNVIGDVKTAKALDNRSLRFAIRDHGYYWQDHMYRTAWHAHTGEWPKFVFLFLDKGPHVFQHRWLNIDAAWLAKAAEEVPEYLAKWKGHEESGHWPQKYPDSVETITEEWVA